MGAAVVFSCFSLPTKLQNLSLNTSSSSSASSTSPSNFPSLSFSSSLSHNVFTKGCLSMSVVQRLRQQSIVCEAAPKKKADSATKRARQAEKRRIYNKSRKSEIRTRMKKVLEALDELKKKPDAQSQEVLPIEKLIAEAYSVIDKAVKVGTLHRNTGACRKSQLARRKKAVEIHHGCIGAPRRFCICILKTHKVKQTVYQSSGIQGYDLCIYSNIGTVKEDGNCFSLSEFPLPTKKPITFFYSAKAHTFQLSHFLL